MRLSHRPDKDGRSSNTSSKSSRATAKRTSKTTASCGRSPFAKKPSACCWCRRIPATSFAFSSKCSQRELNRDQPAEGKTQGFRTVLQEADLEYADTDKSAERVFPVSRDELFAFDVLIFGDVNPALLSPSIMQNIYEFVTVRGRRRRLHGRAAVHAAGLSRYAARAAVSDEPRHGQRPRSGCGGDGIVPPAADASGAGQPEDATGRFAGRQRQAVAQSGSRRSAGSRRCPICGRACACWPSIRPSSATMAASCRSFACNSSARARCCSTPPTRRYRWRFRAGDVYFARYWVQTIRYLCRAKLLAAGSHGRADDRPRAIPPRRSGAAAGAVLRRPARPASDDGVIVVVQRRGRERRSMQRSAATPPTAASSRAAGGLADGQYRSWIASPTLEGQPPSQEFHVSAPPGELARTRMDAAELIARRQDFARQVLSLLGCRPAARRPAPRPAGADRIASAAADLERAALGRLVCAADRRRMDAAEAAGAALSGAGFQPAEFSGAGSNLPGKSKTDGGSSSYEGSICAIIEGRTV